MDTSQLLPKLPVLARYGVRNANSLGAALREFRHLQGMSQQDLADRLGVSRRYIWRLERSQATQHLDRLVEALHAVGARIIIEEDRQPPS